tara:strand:+ start:215 stop:460 length:246 start_codon:yes stop_codon:yes gene_type:complete
MSKEEKIVISLSPIEVNEISYADLENRMDRLEKFIISKLNNYPNEINTLEYETLIQVIIDVVDRNFILNMGFPQLECTYRE